MRPIVINQHYIPRSYLKNFGFLVNAKKKKWSLYSMENGEEIRRRTTESVCSIDYLYDLPFASGDDRQFLEHAYEEHADRHFTEITEFLTNESNNMLPSEMREKILKSCLSLYFRTPKFVELDQKALESIETLPDDKKELAWKVKKTQLLQDSTKNFEQLYIAKKYCGISVNKSVRQWEFISGDNPVIIRNKSGVVEDPFSIENIIHVPLTPRFAISIMPENEVSLRNAFHRVHYDDDHVMGINYDIEKYHQRYLLGSKESLQTYLSESIAYKELVPSDHPKLIKLNRIAWSVQNLVALVARNNGTITNEVKQYFEWCWQNVEGFKDDPNAQEIRKQIFEYH